MYQHFQNFCNETTLHGWQYLAEPSKNRGQKCLWTAVIIGAIILAGYFVVKTTQEYSKSATKTTIQTTTGNLHQVTFPDLVICNINQFQNSVAKKIENSGGQNVKLLYDYYIKGITEWTSEKDMKLNELKHILNEIYSWNETLAPIQAE